LLRAGRAALGARGSAPHPLRPIVGLPLMGPSCGARDKYTGRRDGYSACRALAQAVSTAATTGTSLRPINWHWPDHSVAPVPASWAVASALAFLPDLVRSGVDPGQPPDVAEPIGHPQSRRVPHVVAGVGQSRSAKSVLEIDDRNLDRSCRQPVWARFVFTQPPLRAPRRDPLIVHGRATNAAPAGDRREITELAPMASSAPWKGP